MNHIKSLLFSQTTLIHFPVGVIAGLLLWFATPAGYMLTIGFLAYEIIEAIQIKDKAHRDMFGFLLAQAIVGCLQILFRFFLLA